MATIGNGVMTLADWAKIQGPDGKIAKTVEILSQTNEVLDDMMFKEGNLATGERTTIRTGLPTAYWRKVNAGVPTSKSTSAQVDESCGILESWSAIDKDIAELGGNVNQVRFNEAVPFMESMSQEMASTLFYGDASNPEEFEGFSSRYGDLAATNAQNIIDAGGSQSDNSSIWLIGWGERTVHGVFPQGSKAGLTHEDKGLQTVEAAGGVAGNLMDAYRDKFQWKCGLVVKDWRYAVRIANIDISALIADPAAATFDLQELMLKAIHRLPTRNGVKLGFYCNRTISEMLDIQAQNKANLQLNVGNEEGDFKTRLRNIPINTVDALTEAEARVV